VDGIREGDRQAPPPVRPPGARSPEAEFAAACERCGKCSQACPYDVIRHLGPEAGATEGTPFLTPDTDPCRWCPTMDCIHACPTDALQLVAGQRPAPMALAVVDPAACLNSQGILCDECASVCPSDVRAVTVSFGKTPVIDQQACTGCGLCVFHCAAEPKALSTLAPGLPR
jgi:MauM/NapG family ferredoxin protein